MRTDIHVEHAPVPLGIRLQSIAREPVKSLGRIEEDTMADLAEIARSHRSGDVRRQAVEIMSWRDPDRALPILERILKEPQRRDS